LTADIAQPNRHRERYQTELVELGRRDGRVPTFTPRALQEYYIYKSHQNAANKAHDEYKKVLGKKGFPAGEKMRLAHRWAEGAWVYVCP